jgi:hypothetical protein
MPSVRIARVRLDEVAPIEAAIEIDGSIEQMDRVTEGVEETTRRLEEIISGYTQGFDRLQSKGR